MHQIKFVIFSFFFCLPCATEKTDADWWQKKAEIMVKNQLERRGIQDEEVLRVMRKTPRHLFVPKNLEDAAYEDGPLPIGEGQTISQPYIVALMTELLELNGNERILEIGTGSGYQAAILSPLVKEVYSIEIVKSLAENADKKLKEMQYHNVMVKLEKKILFPSALFLWFILRKHPWIAINFKYLIKYPTKRSFKL